MSTVSAYAATSPTEPLTKTTITRRDPGPHDVAFDIMFAGICHSDIHTVKAEWGKPMTVIGTGGVASLFEGATDSIDHFDSDLTIRGLLAIWRRNAHLTD